MPNKSLADDVMRDNGVAVESVWCPGHVDLCVDALGAKCSRIHGLLTGGLLGHSTGAREDRGLTGNLFSIFTFER